MIAFAKIAFSTAGSRQLPTVLSSPAKKVDEPKNFSPELPG